MKSLFWRRWLQTVFGAKQARRATEGRARRRMLCLEALEDRTVPTLTPQMVLDIWPGFGSPNSSFPSHMVAIGSTAYFTAYDDVHGEELWKSDGTAAGTVLVKDNATYPGSGSYPRNLTNVNGTLFFTTNNGTQLWQSDGTAAGTVPVGNFANLNASELTYVNGTWFFRADDGEHGQELWKSDGTAVGTTVVKDLYPGTRIEYYCGYGSCDPYVVVNSSYPSSLTNVNGALFFTADDGVNGRVLWKSDGTEAGTVMVSSLAQHSDLTDVNGTLFFAAFDGTGAQRLWQSDGTEAGTVPVANFANLSATWLTNVNGTWFFRADDGEHGLELWKLVDDGQTQSTSLDVGGFPATVTAGAGGSFTVTVKYADGTINTNYRGTVQFSSSDQQAVLPASYTFTDADQGSHTFSATLKTAGSQSITVRDNVFPVIGGTQTGIAVAAAAASRFTVAGFPASVTAGWPVASPSPPGMRTSTESPATPVPSASPAATVRRSCRATTPSPRPTLACTPSAPRSRRPATSR